MIILIALALAIADAFVLHAAGFDAWHNAIASVQLGVGFHVGFALARKVNVR